MYLVNFYPKIYELIHELGMENSNFYLEDTGVNLGTKKSCQLSGLEWFKLTSPFEWESSLCENLQPLTIISIAFVPEQNTAGYGHIS